LDTVIDSRNRIGTGKSLLNSGEDLARMVSMVAASLSITVNLVVCQDSFEKLVRIILDFRF
jgi:hypothetical protein